MDQTQFTKDQETLLPPPGEVYLHQDLLSAQPPPKKKPLKLILAAAAIGVAIVSTLLLLLVTNPGIFPGAQPEATPYLPPATPTPAPARQTEFGRRFQDLKNQLDAADPSLIQIAPPQIDLNLSL